MNAVPMFKKLSAILLLIHILINATAQSYPDSATFIVHRHLKPIGFETYHLLSDNVGNKIFNIDCSYSDRGVLVPLKTTVVLDSLSQLRLFESKGATSRFSKISDTVRIISDSIFTTRVSVTTSKHILPNFFPIDGYAPATMQWLLIKKWERMGKPDTIFGFHAEPVEIRGLGMDTLGKPGSVMTAYGIKNVIWGWEFLWVDASGQLAALTTINAEGDKIEFVLDKYESLLNEFSKKSAVYGVAAYPLKKRQVNDIAIIHAELIDIQTGEEFHDQTILIKSGKIFEKGPSEKIKIPKATTIVDAAGRHLLPGLWDMHAHVKQVEWGPAYIAAGITTVRDMANEFDFINTVKTNIDEGNGIGPTILKAGIIDGPGPLGNGVRIAETPEQAIALVREYKATGFEQIKLYGSLQPDIIKIICDEAHRQGLIVTGHIPRSITLLQGIEMGMNQVSHSQYIYRAFTADSNLNIDLGTPANQIVLQALLKNKIVIDPTLAVFEVIIHPIGQSFSDIEPNYLRLPSTLREQFDATGSVPAESKKRRLIFEAQKRMVLALYKAGVPIVAGTDMLFPGYSLYRELELYVASGLTPLQSLQSATLIPARTMNRLSSSGTVEIGKDADFILVDGDPLKNISDIRKISLVIKGGQMYNPKELHRMVDFN